MFAHCIARHTETYVLTVYYPPKLSQGIIVRQGEALGCP